MQTFRLYEPMRVLIGPVPIILKSIDVLFVCQYFFYRNGEDLPSILSIERLRFSEQ